MTSPVIWSRCARFPPGNTSVVRAREFVGAELDARDMTYLVDSVELVVSEFVTNAVDRTHTSIGVSLEELLFCVRLTVRNGTSSTMSKTARSTDEGGRSSLIVERVSARWGVGTAPDGDTSAWALFELRAPSYEAWAARGR
jgi:hypothetical protein